MARHADSLTESELEMAFDSQRMTLLVGEAAVIHEQNKQLEDPSDGGILFEPDFDINKKTDKLLN